MAALIAAATGYETVADFTDTTPQPDFASSGASLGAFFSAVLAAATGYETVADFTDTTPQPDFASSGASLGAFFHALIQGRYIEFGGGSEEMWGIVGE
jgi:uncharacterized membrane protein required for colicin V production